MEKGSSRLWAVVKSPQVSQSKQLESNCSLSKTSEDTVTQADTVMKWVASPHQVETLARLCARLVCVCDTLHCCFLETLPGVQGCIHSPPPSPSPITFPPFLLLAAVRTHPFLVFSVIAHPQMLPAIACAKHETKSRWDTCR